MPYIAVILHTTEAIHELLCLELCNLQMNFLQYS